MGMILRKRIRRAQAGLNAASRTLAGAMYRESKSGAGPRTSGGPADGEVVDAEFTNASDRKPCAKAGPVGRAIRWMPDC